MRGRGRQQRSVCRPGKREELVGEIARDLVALYLVSYRACFQVYAAVRCPRAVHDWSSGNAACKCGRCWSNLSWSSEFASKKQCDEGVVSKRVPRLVKLSTAALASNTNPYLMGTLAPSRTTAAVVG